MRSIPRAATKTSAHEHGIHDTCVVLPESMVGRSKKGKGSAKVDKAPPKLPVWKRAESFAERKFGACLLALATLATTVRLLVTLSVWSLPHSYLVAADLAHYHRDGLIVAGLEGGNLAPVFGLSPLATLWGALWYFLFGPSAYSVVIPQIGVGVGSVLLTALIGRRVGNPAVGLVAGVMVALSRPLVGFDIALLDTSLSVFLSLLAVWTTLWCVERPALGRVGLVGLVLGVGAVCRPNSLLISPAVFLVVWAATRTLVLPRRALLAAALVLCTVLPIAPVTVYNYVRGHAFVPVTHTAGMNLFFGNYRQSTGRLEPGLGCSTAAEAFDYFEKKAIQLEGRQLNAAEVSSFWTQQALSEIQQNPTRWFGLIGRKALFSLNSVENPDSWSMPFLELAAPLTRLPFVTFGLLFPLGLLGLALLWRKGPPGTRTIHAVCASCWIVMVAFFVSSRFRAPAQPLLAIGAAVALHWIVASFARPSKPWKALASAAILVGIATYLVELPILEPVMEPEIQALSQAYSQEHRDAQALATFERIRDAADTPELATVRQWASHAIDIHKQAMEKPR